MRKWEMAWVALALVAPATASGQQATQQQEEKRQAATRQQLQQKMRELEQQLRQLQREMAQIEPRTRRPVVARTPMPMVDLFAGRAYLGVNVAWDKTPATDSIGAVLASVSPGGPADEAGLKAGDIITTFNGEKLAGRYPAAGEEESEPGRKLVDFAHRLDEGDTVRVDYRRGKESRHATIVARQLEAKNWFTMTAPMPPMPKVHVETGDLALPGEIALAGVFGGWRDLELVALNPELGEYFGTSEGLLVIRAPDDSSLNLKGGDVIVAIDGRKPTSQSQVARILRSYGLGEEVRIDIMRQKRKMTVTAKIPERRSRRDEWDRNWER
jgi:S1-C subfamily serine protease